MATKSAILSVKIISDAKDFKKGTDEAASGLDQFKSKMKSLTLPALAVGAGLLKVGSDFGKMASDFEQNSGAVDAVFKNMSGQVDQLASESAKKLGLSANDYKQYAALIGSQLKNGGTSMDQLVGKTDMLLNTGADFAAQFGGTVPDAVAALSSALKGEMDPIEKYGISLNQSKIDAEAAAMGFEKVNGALTDQQKQAAILSLIQKQGADSLGANAREAGTAAGAQARLTAAYNDMGVKVGTVLLPIMSKAAEILGVVVDWVSQNTGLVQGLAVGLGILAAAILVINIAMAIMNAIAALNPFVLLAVAVAALVAGIIYLATQTTFFQDLWATVAKFCADVWNGFVGFITDAWTGFMGFINDALGNIGNFFASIFNGIGNFVGGIVSNIRNFFAVGFAFVASIVGAYINAVMGIIRGIIGVVSSVTGFVSSAFSNAFNTARNIVSGVINFIVGGFNNIVGAVSNVIGWVSRLFNGFSVPGWLRDVMNFMGLGMTGVEMSIGHDLTGLPAGMGASGLFSMGGAGFGASSGRTEINNYNITVNGALDSNAVARQLTQLINSDAIRTGKIDRGGSIW
ncbi:hypothetical protein [Arthrobacter sp. CJ23]|uniref:phage tail protein n=1 Tax=Arthrobacter sp. CJ23 TaxID=2972479 RepID=UPI00215C9163|nr:hypothetical protein [Arthrobacter sp. CJ23]UVJ37986.1 hypothetical protein NVV90_11985 [Arthrobacter sp. CJ23]